MFQRRNIGRHGTAKKVVFYKTCAIFYKINNILTTEKMNIIGFVGSKLKSITLLS